MCDQKRAWSLASTVKIGRAERGRDAGRAGKRCVSRPLGACYYARPYDLRDGTLGDRLRFVNPTTFVGVPRVWEKFQAALEARLSEAEGFKGKLARWAMETELACFHEQVERGVRAKEHMPLKRRAARALVLDKIKTALGLDRLEIAITGSLSQYCLQSCLCSEVTLYMVVTM